MFKNSVFYKLFLAVTALALVQMACSLPTSTPTPAAGSGGIVKGVVYGDLNGNGAADPGEGPLDGVQVTLAGCGATQSQVTAADGAFNFTSLPAGSCQVSVTKAGWHFSGSFPSLSYPVPVASNPALPTAFSMFMAPDTAAAAATATTAPILPTATFTLTPSATATLPPTATLGPAMVTPNDKNANCRFGPGTDFSVVGALNVGQIVPILGTVSDRTWWQITNPWSTGTQCWVSNSVTTASGDLTKVPVLPVPGGLVTTVTVSVSPGAVVHGFCGGPNAVSFSVSITTNGPAKVTYHLEIYNEDGSLRNKTDDATLTFAAADTQTFDPGGAYKTDCGKYTIKVIVTSPNNKTGQASWSVVSP